MVNDVELLWWFTEQLKCRFAAAGGVTATRVILLWAPSEWHGSEWFIDFIVISSCWKNGFVFFQWTNSHACIFGDWIKDDETYLGMIEITIIHAWGATGADSCGGGYSEWKEKVREREGDNNDERMKEGKRTMKIRESKKGWAIERRELEQAWDGGWGWGVVDREGKRERWVKQFLNWMYSLADPYTKITELHAPFIYRLITP